MIQQQLYNLNLLIKLYLFIKQQSLFQIKDAIEEVFRIRCPQSIQNKVSATTFAVFDFESECQYDEKELGLTTFCGKCARKNSNSLFWNVNSPITYNIVCISFFLVT
jgi:hypothetical protein